MRSSFKSLGEFIRIVDERNSEMLTSSVLGINIDKYFMPSVANIVGTDLSKYKLLRYGRFACNPMHVGRDGRLPIARYTEEFPALVSPAYFMFEISDHTEIDPEYLMLCFRRPDFDRMCAYKADASVRGGITWEDICALTIPIPPIKEQRKIVRDYQVITDRIALLRKINENLRATGVAIIEKFIGTAALINKTQSELDSMTLPENWNIITVEKYCNYTKSGATPSRDNPDFWINGNIPWLKSGEVHNGINIKTEEFITQRALENSSTKLLPANTVLMAMYGVTAGEIGYLASPATTNQAVCGMVCSNSDDAAYLFFALLQSQKAASRLSNGGAQNNLNKMFIDGIHLIHPPTNLISSLSLSSIIQQMISFVKEVDILEQLQTMILTDQSNN